MKISKQKRIKIKIVEEGTTYYTGGSNGPSTGTMLWSFRDFVDQEFMTNNKNLTTIRVGHRRSITPRVHRVWVPRSETPPRL